MHRSYQHKYPMHQETCYAIGTGTVFYNPLKAVGLVYISLICMPRRRPEARMFVALRTARGLNLTPCLLFSGNYGAYL